MLILKTVTEYTTVGVKCCRWEAVGTVAGGIAAAAIAPAAFGTGTAATVGTVVLSYVSSEIGKQMGSTQCENGIRRGSRSKDCR